MITRRSFLWQMFGAGLWAAIAGWFREEPTVEPPKEELRDIGEPIEWTTILSLEPYQWKALRSWENEHYYMLRTRHPIAIIRITEDQEEITLNDVYDMRPFPRGYWETFHEQGLAKFVSVPETDKRHLGV